MEGAAQASEPAAESAPVNSTPAATVQEAAATVSTTASRPAFELLMKAQRKPAADDSPASAPASHRKRAKGGPKS
eukprot:5290395-Prymnesium_polylepis.1